MENKKKKIIFVVVLFAVIIILFVVLQNSAIINLDINSYGHGKYSSGGFTSLLQSLNIADYYDYINEAGEEICYNDEWEVY